MVNPQSRQALTLGLELLKQFAVEDETKVSLLTVAEEKYYALCAASALLLHATQKGVEIQNASVMIKCETMKGASRTARPVAEYRAHVYRRRDCAQLGTGSEQPDNKRDEYPVLYGVA